MKESVRRPRGRAAALGSGKFAARALLVATLLSSLLIVAPRIPHADAAFPGRNGRIAWPVVQPPFSEFPESLVTQFVVERDIFTISPDGEAIQRVTDGIDDDHNPAWSPDGTKIVFGRRDLSYGRVTGEIFVIDSDGSNLTNLSNTPLFYEHAASWSPDGKQIVFSSDRASPDPLGRPGFGVREAEQDLFIMDADGSNVVPLTNDAGAEWWPAWSPNGEWIAFVKGRAVDVSRIELIRVDGSDRRVLADGFAPQWSPDGSKLVFPTEGAAVPGPESEIFVINFDGSGLRNLTAGPNGDNRFPSWSPNGRWLVFTSNRAKEGGWKLYKMRADGSHVTQLVDIDLAAGAVSADWGPRP